MTNGRWVGNIHDTSNDHGNLTIDHGLIMESEFYFTFSVGTLVSGSASGLVVNKHSKFVI